MQNMTASALRHAPRSAVIAQPGLCALAGLLAALLLALTPIHALPAEDPEDTSWDGLEMLETSAVAVAFVDPAADFSVFRRVAILDPYVAFRSNWRRDQNRSSRTRNVRPTDMERISSDVGRLFLDVFVERLEEAGYAVVNYADEDVLLLRPSIIDLDVSAPDVNRGRMRTYSASTGAASLLVELFDSVTGDLIGRAADRRVARRSNSFVVQANRVTNRQAARREFIVWADALIAFLDRHYLKASEAAAAEEAAE